MFEIGDYFGLEMRHIRQELETHEDIAQHSRLSREDNPLKMQRAKSLDR